MAECHDKLVEDPRYRDIMPKATLSERAAVILWAVVLWLMCTVGFIAATKAHGQVPCEQQANAARFQWATQKAPQGDAAAFCWACQKHGCDCGAGCPCCNKPGGCTCKAPGQCAEDANYNSLRTQAIREGKTLIVSVGCPVRPVDGCLSCRLEQFPGLKAPVIAVCRTVNGQFARVSELKLPCTDADVRRCASHPPVGSPAVQGFQNCPNGNCPLQRSFP